MPPLVESVPSMRVSIPLIRLNGLFGPENATKPRSSPLGEDVLNALDSDADLHEAQKKETTIQHRSENASPPYRWTQSLPSIKW